MEYLTIKNFSKFQHYKERNPPWIKIHRELFLDYEFGRLQDASKLHLMLIWLLASQKDNKLPNDPEYIREQIHVKEEVDLNLLVSKGFLIPLEECKQDASTLHTNADSETETETETETEAEAETEKHELLKKKKRKGGKAENINSKKVLDYLNEKAGKRFQSTKENMGFINARLETYSVEQLFHVVDVKVDEWLDDPKWDTYLRPSTLFNREKCETYVNQKRGLLKITETTGSKKLDQIKRLMGDDQQIKLLGVK